MASELRHRPARKASATDVVALPHLHRLLSTASSTPCATSCQFLLSTSQSAGSNHIPSSSAIQTTTNPSSFSIQSASLPGSAWQDSVREPSSPSDHHDSPHEFEHDSVLSPRGSHDPSSLYQGTAVFAPSLPTKGPSHSEAHDSAPTRSKTDDSTPTHSEAHDSTPYQSETHHCMPTDSETHHSIPTHSPPPPSLKLVGQRGSFDCPARTKEPSCSPLVRSPDSSSATHLSPPTQEHASPPPPSLKQIGKSYFNTHQPLLSGAAYCSTSISMTLLNKVIISSHNFGHPTTLVCFQCCVAMALVMLCRRLGIAKRARVSPALVLTWFPISFLFIGMIWTGTLVIKHLNVPTMSVLKNINNFLIIIGEYVLYRKVYRSTVWVTLFLIVLSAYCSAVTDLTFTLRGLFWQLVNSSFTAAYTLALRSQYALLQKKLDDNLDTCTHLLFKTLNAVPLLLTLALLNGELATVRADPALSQPGFWQTSFTAACGSFLISMCATWFMTNTTATTFGIVSALAKIPTVVISIVFMGTATSTKNLLSVAFGIMAGALFTWEKQRGKS